METIVQTCELFWDAPLYMTWLELRGVLYWVFLWWRIPAELKELEQMILAVRKYDEQNKKLQRLLFRHRLLDFVHRGMGMYSPAITLRGRIALWMYTRGRVWAPPGNYGCGC